MMSFPTTPAQKFRAALASSSASVALVDRLYLKLEATQPNADPLDSLRNTDPSTRQTSLHIAANAGRLDLCEWLLEQGVEREISRDAAGETVLHLAAAKGHVDIIATYLEQFRFVVDWTNSRGMTPLHTAAMRGELEAAQILVENGADINAPDLHGNTPLHYALSWGKLTVVKLLVELDCETDLRNNQGFSASDFAYSFSAADALKVYVRLHHDAQKAARRATKSRRPRNPRIDSGASSASRGLSRTGSSSDIFVSVPTAVPSPTAQIASPPLQPIGSPQGEPAASPALSTISSKFPTQYGLGVGMNSPTHENGDALARRDSPLPAPIAVRAGPTSPSAISLQPATPTTPQTPHSPGYPHYNTTSPARSPVHESSSPQLKSTSPRPQDDTRVRPQLQLQSQPHLRSRMSQEIKRSQSESPTAIPEPSSSYFPSGIDDGSSRPASRSPTHIRSSSTRANLPRSTSSSSDLVASAVGPKKLRKKGTRRDSWAQQEQQRPASAGSVPAGSTVLGGGPGGKKLRSERSMSFGTAMASTSAGAPRIDTGRSRSATVQSMSSTSDRSDSIPALPTVRPKPEPRSAIDTGMDMHPPAIPPVDSVDALTTRSHEPSFVVVSGSTTKNSPIAPSVSTFPNHRASSSVSTTGNTSISLGRPPGLASTGRTLSGGSNSTEGHKLRKSSASAAKAKERIETEPGKSHGGRFARVLGFARKAT
ncbi:uncharacterized protein JCM15063_001283 [Sporobolomyces koalae]|uniref:uncharacterized protein n=1 Tax=Sporobolomyces koalae TaxID=500713 RepID=UPI00316F4B7C